MNWILAPEIKKKINLILTMIDMEHIQGERLTVFRSFGSTGRAIARIWSLPRVWQQALSVPPQYVIEVISERFDRMNQEDQDRTLIHELMHIPKTFSGALVAHRGRQHRIDRRTVEILYQKYYERSHSR